MACEFLTKNFDTDCIKGSISGIKNIGFSEYKQGITLDVDGTVDPVALTKTVFQYSLATNDSVMYDEKIENNNDTLTSIATGTLSLDIPVLTKSVRDQLRLLSYGRPHVFLELYSGDIVMMGREFGAKLDSLNLLTGGKKNDMAGFKLSFSSMEGDLIPYLSATSVTKYRTLVAVNTPS